MRYLVFLSLFALALYAATAATAEDIYKIYKTKGINAVEDFLKKEFEPKEVKAVAIKEVKKEKEVVKEPTVKLGEKLFVKPKTPTEKESISR